MPTSLEMVLERLGVTEPTREQRLIAANDKGYIEGLIAAGATAEEVERIRHADRTAQGITAEQEEQAAAAIAALITSVPGLTIVRLPHARTATVTDRLNIHAGSPGYSNLLILSPTEVAFFGDGKVISLLYEEHGGYCGGLLPITGFWGLETSNEHQRKAITAEVFRQEITSQSRRWSAQSFVPSIREKALSSEGPRYTTGSSATWSRTASGRVSP